MSKSEPLVSSLNRLFKTKIKMLPLSFFFLPVSNPIYQQCLLLLPSKYIPDPATSHHSVSITLVEVTVTTHSNPTPAS